MMSTRTMLGAGLVLAISGTLAVATLADTGGHGSHGPAAGAPARQPVRTTMEELHRQGGVPPGWRFVIPAGDPKAGREVFARLECNKCHAVKGDFPEPSKEPGNAGPELTGMGGHHPPEYMVQSILDPNAVIVMGPGHTGPDGLSIMPSFVDSLTVPELLDLVAYLGSLSDGDADHHDDHARADAREQVVGDYRIRVAYHAHGHQVKASPGHGHAAKPASGHGHEAKTASGHDHGTKPTAARARDHLMVFVVDAKTGEPVPYLPVTVTVHAGKTAPRTVKLSPMVSDRGFHYGADVTLPGTTEKVTVVIGPTTMKVMPSASGRFAGTARATFEWPR